jgi:hypothetical protein
MGNSGIVPNQPDTTDLEKFKNHNKCISRIIKVPAASTLK